MMNSIIEALLNGSQYYQKSIELFCLRKLRKYPQPLSQLSISMCSSGLGFSSPHMSSEWWLRRKHFSLLSGMWFRFSKFHFYPEPINLGTLYPLMALILAKMVQFRKPLLNFEGGWTSDEWKPINELSNG